MSVIFTIPTHVLNTTDANNYTVRTPGKWPCEDTIRKGPFPSAPLGGFKNSPEWHKMLGAAPETFYNSLFALVLATLRFKEMPWGPEQGHGDLKGTDFVEKELGVKGFNAVDLLSVFVLSNGGNPDGNFLSMDYDLRTLLLEGKTKDLAKTDFCVYRDSCLGKHTSSWYNSSPENVFRKLRKLFLRPTGQRPVRKFLQSGLRYSSRDREKRIF